MTKVVFLADKGHINGFKISGHSSTDCEDQEGKIVCSAVSSAAYMAANTVTEIIGAKAKATAADGAMHFEVCEECDKCLAVLKGFELHMTELSKQYPQNIKVIYGGVKNA